MRPASDAQKGYLVDLHNKHPEVFEQQLAEQKLTGRSIASLTVAEATLLISAIVPIVKSGKEGKDGGEGEIHDHGHGEGQQGGSQGQGQGQGQNQQQGQGEGQGQQQGQGQGQGEGEGQGEGGSGENQDQEGKQMQHEYREGSKQQIVADALIRNNMDERATFEELKDQIGRKPLEFTHRTENGKEPLPMGSENDPTSAATQYGRGSKLIKDTKNAMEKDPKNQGQNQQQQGGGQQEGGQQQQGGSGEQKKQEHPGDYVYRKLMEGIDLQLRMAADGKEFGTWGMRQFIYAAKMLNAGFPPAYILDAISMEWPKDLRREWMDDGKNLPEFDVTKLWKPEQRPGYHAALPALTRLAMAGVPPFLVGPAGTGKTTLAKQVHDRINEIRGTEYEFGFASMTAGTSPGEFKGRITLDGFLPSLFVQIFSEGGVFLFDELDAGDENLLTLLHAALSNGWFVDNRGKRHTASEHFVAMAAGNTLGLGANTTYTGRNRLDGATLDRFGAGRVRIALDKVLTKDTYYGILASK